VTESEAQKLLFTESISTRKRKQCLYREVIDNASWTGGRMMDGSTKKWMEITCRYYSKWLGQEEILLHDFQGAVYVYSQERNTVQYGYGSQFDLYVLCQKNRAVISYGDRAGDKLDGLKAEMEKVMSAGVVSAEEVGRILERSFGSKASHGIKYVLGQTPSILSGARVLTMEDYGEYDAFWRNCHPGCKDTDWLQEYFAEMVQENRCIGAFADGKLVSCTDAPGMPYMGSQVQEIGINTLPDYRRKGYASSACIKCLDEILSRHKVPQWSTAVSNQASRKLAERIGFVEFAEVITLSL